MITKVFVSKSVEDLLYEIKQDFPDGKIFHCSDLSFADFCVLHKPGLHTCKTDTYCFLEVDEYYAEELQTLLETKITLNIVWGFKSLAKNTKVFKKLEANSSIEFCEVLDNSGRKSKFIKGKLKELGLPSSLDKLVYNYSSDSKLMISQELEKLSYIMENLSEVDADPTEVLCSFSSDMHLIDFVAAFFKKDLRTLLTLMNRVVTDYYELQFYKIFSKRIISFMFLALGDEEMALKNWRSFGYFLEEDRRTAKSFGFPNLLKLQQNLDRIFIGNSFSDKPFDNKVREFILFFSKDLCQL